MHFEDLEKPTLKGGTCRRSDHMRDVIYQAAPFWPIRGKHMPFQFINIPAFFKHFIIDLPIVNFGQPLGLFDCTQQVNIFLGNLSQGIRRTCPAHSSCFFITYVSREDFSDNLSNKSDIDWWFCKAIYRFVWHIAGTH